MPALNYAIGRLNRERQVRQLEPSVAGDLSELNSDEGRVCRAAKAYQLKVEPMLAVVYQGTVTTLL
jgi:hypothetical protein